MPKKKNKKKALSGIIKKLNSTIKTKSDFL